MATPVYPATNNAEAIELNISNANQFFTILRGGVDDFIATYEGNGEIPSVAKALHEAAAYKAPLPWETSGLQSDILQPRVFQGLVFVPLIYNAPFSTRPNFKYWRLLSQPSGENPASVYFFTGDGSTTIFQLPALNATNAAAYLVFVDGVSQRATVDYTVNTTLEAIQFTEAPPETSVDNISVVLLGNWGLPEPLPAETFNADRVNRQQTALQRSVKQSGDDLDQTLRSDFANQSFSRGDKAVGFIEFTEEFDEQYDFSRGSEATYIDATGVLRTAEVDEPRFTHDPVTGEPLGLLIEEQRTNLLLWSEDYSQGAWDKLGVSVQADSSVAPDDTNTADSLIEDTTNGGHYITQNFTVTSGDQFVFSAYFKPNGRNYVQVLLTSSGFGINILATFDLTTGETVGAGGTNPQFDAEILSNGWVRCYFSAEATADSTSQVQIRVSDSLSTSPASYQGDGTSGIYIWSAQLEPGSTPSSYNPTTDAQVTRATDQVSRVLGSEFNPGSFSVIARGIQSVGVADSAQRLLSINNGSNDERITITRSSLITSVGGSSTVTGSVANIPNNANVGIAYDGAILTIAVNGVTWFNGPRILNPDQFTQIQIGRDPILAVRGATFERIKMLPRALTESELIALTSPEAN